jgi:hypothetical protein
VAIERAYEQDEVKMIEHARMEATVDDMERALDALVGEIVKRKVVVCGISWVCVRDVTVGFIVADGVMPV